ncbi:hypothetical protein DPMN_124825 [Dreissena polymorpha]|uniref:Uncharacterized protein n=1 Tax=Dreissena polymorpha TaxID=45954 RepID=A0A9D4GU04_DREPO|nr:hypothetical protein DPMN_124825 [Dreissena polymorpha]
MPQAYTQRDSHSGSCSNEGYREMNQWLHCTLCVDHVDRLNAKGAPVCSDTNKTPVAEAHHEWVIVRIHLCPAIPNLDEIEMTKQTLLRVEKKKSKESKCKQHQNNSIKCENTEYTNEYRNVKRSIRTNKRPYLQTLSTEAEPRRRNPSPGE